MDIEKLKENSTLIGYLGALIATISVFLPFITVSFMGFSESANYFEGDGKLVLLSVLVGAGLMVIKKGKLSWIPTAIAALLLIITLFNGNSELGDYNEFYHYSIGLYSLIIGLVLMGAYGYLYDKDKDKCKYVVDNFKLKK